MWRRQNRGRGPRSNVGQNNRHGSNTRGSGYHHGRGRGSQLASNTNSRGNNSVIEKGGNIETYSRNNDRDNNQGSVRDRLGIGEFQKADQARTFQHDRGDQFGDREKVSRDHEQYRQNSQQARPFEQLRAFDTAITKWGAPANDRRKQPAYSGKLSGTSGKQPDKGVKQPSTGARERNEKSNDRTPSRQSDRRDDSKQSIAKHGHDKRNQSSHARSDSSHKQKDARSSHRDNSSSRQHSGHSADKARHDKPASHSAKKDSHSHETKSSGNTSHHKTETKSSEKKSSNVTSTKLTNSARSSSASKKPTGSTSSISKGDRSSDSKRDSKKEADIKKECDIKDSKGSRNSRSLDRKQNTPSRRSSQSDRKRNTVTNKDYGNYHDDDILSILADDDRFDKETKRLFGDDPVTVDVTISDGKMRNRGRNDGNKTGLVKDCNTNLDADPFQIHAESSSSVFDEVNVSSVGLVVQQKGTFKIPTGHREHSTNKNSLSRDRQTRNQSSSSEQKSSHVKGFVSKSKQSAQVASGKITSLYRKRSYGSKAVDNFKKPVMARKTTRHEDGNRNQTRPSRGGSNSQQVFRKEEIGRTGAVLKEDRGNMANLRRDSNENTNRVADVGLSRVDGHHVDRVYNRDADIGLSRGNDHRSVYNRDADIGLSRVDDHHGGHVYNRDADIGLSTGNDHRGVYSRDADDGLHRGDDPHDVYNRDADIGFSRGNEHHGVYTRDADIGLSRGNDHHGVYTRDDDRKETSSEFRQVDQVNDEYVRGDYSRGDEGYRGDDTRGYGISYKREDEEYRQDDVRKDEYRRDTDEYRRDTDEYRRDTDEYRRDRDVYRKDEEGYRRGDTYGDVGGYRRENTDDYTKTEFSQSLVHTNKDGEFNQTRVSTDNNPRYRDRSQGQRGNSYKSKGNAQFDRVKKKYFNNRFSKTNRTFGNRGNRGRGNWNKTQSRARDKDRHSEAVPLQEKTNLKPKPADANQSVLFIPNKDLPGGYPQFVDQFGNVMNPGPGVYQGEVPVPLHFAPSNIPPEVPPGEQLIFIPFNQLPQQAGFSENSFPMATDGERRFVVEAPFQNLQEQRKPGQAVAVKNVRNTIKKPLSREQRAKLRSRLLLKQKERIEKQVEQRLLKKLLGKSNDGKTATSSQSNTVKAKPLLKRITPPSADYNAARKQIRLTKGSHKNADLEDVSNDEYDEVSDLEDITDDDENGENLKMGRGGEKRPAFRKPGQPRINASPRKGQLSYNVRPGNNDSYVRPQNDDVRKVVDRTGGLDSDKNRRINIVSNKSIELSTGQGSARKRPSNIVVESPEKRMRPKETDRNIGSLDGNESDNQQRRERIYEKRPISPLQITVSNERFSKTDSAGQTRSTPEHPYKSRDEGHNYKKVEEKIKGVRSPQYTRRSHERYADSRTDDKDSNKRIDKSTDNKYVERTSDKNEQNNYKAKRNEQQDSPHHERKDSYTKRGDMDKRNITKVGKYNDNEKNDDDRNVRKDQSENSRYQSRESRSPKKDQRIGRYDNKRQGNDRVETGYRKDRKDSGQSRSKDREDDQRTDRRDTKSLRDERKSFDDNRRNSQGLDKAKRSYQPSQGHGSSRNNRDKDRSTDTKKSSSGKQEHYSSSHQGHSQLIQHMSHPQQPFQQVQGHFHTSQGQQFTFQPTAMQQQHNIQFLNTSNANDPSLPPMTMNQVPMNMPPLPPSNLGARTDSSLGVGPDMSMPPPQEQMMGSQMVFQQQQQPIQQQQFQQPIQQTMIQPIQQQQFQQIQSQQFQQQPQQFQQQITQQQQMQQQLSMNNNQQFQTSATGMNQPIYQTGIQSMTSSQQNTGLQNISGSPMFAMQSNQQQQNPSQGNQFQQQQSGSGNMLQLNAPQTQGQFQTSQSSGQPMSLISNQQTGSSQQNFQQAQPNLSRSQSTYIATTPQQAVSGVLRTIGQGPSPNSGGLLRAPAIPSLLGTFQTQMKSGRGIKVPQGTLQYGNNQSSNRHLASSSTISKAPSRAGAHFFAEEEEDDEEEDEDDIAELLCTKCDKVFMSDTVMRKHGLWHEQVENHRIDLRCDNCEQAFLSSGALNNHLSEKHTADSWNCNMCDITFTNSSALAKHMRVTSHKPLGYKFACSQCKATFKFLKQLLSHKKDIHQDQASSSYSSNLRRY